ncbi:PREDICTED: prostaglandin reductase 1-like isoform X1 [Nicrophorus vespilloides]|uniref:Prostaglandin reductase 1 n=2 Tax=Nicrophorus vespilloides TaxID=110193 RepID=A0ABM1MUF5_NICVS|nr:PREDICTED: prostaglandin reductase 1-like isoform X1 [Nicrophorus vespilloides]
MIILRGYIKHFQRQFSIICYRNSSKMVKAKSFIYAKHFKDMPQASNFDLIEEELPEIKDEEFLCEAVFLSIDPYMRAYASMLPVGITMIGSQVAKVIDSKNLQYPVGSYVLGSFGWRSHTIWGPNNKKKSSLEQTPYIVPDLIHHPISLYLGILGMTGNTALFGFLDVCKPMAGETVVITGAAGAVGSHVGQIAKIKGCRVIGISGTDEKGEWLKSIGFDDYINYKTVTNFSVKLKELAPNGIDCYFDNVGGELTSLIMQQMNKFGRISVCGSISAYNNDYNSLPKATILQPSIVANQLTMSGIHATNYYDRWMSGIKQNKMWLEEGKLIYKEHVVDGFENMPNALIGILNGVNTGKVVVKV